MGPGKCPHERRRGRCRPRALRLTRTAYATLLALCVAIADLIPLAGATLGAIPAIVVGFLVSPLVGIVVTAFFILYQQLENTCCSLPCMDAPSN